MPTLGGPELLIILVIVLVLFGGSRIANVGKSVGGAFRGFKDGVMGEPAAPKEAPVKVARDRQ
jgi:sec-independent protein translocase protein TatA